MAVWEAFLWTGDWAFLKEMYPLCRKGVLEWLLKTQDTNGDLFPEGYGITEVAGLDWELVDTRRLHAAGLGGPGRNGKASRRP